MTPQRLILTVAAMLALALPATAHAGAEGPGTPQATAANATFLATAPAPPTGAGAVCVIDSGVDTNTDLGPALAGRSALLGGTPGDPSDTGATSDTGEPLSKHGTYVAGVIASQIDGVGTNGIWPAARIFSARVFAGGGGAQAADYIRAMDWCGNQPHVKVINLSLSGLTQTTTTERDALNDQIGQMRALRGINVVAATGNNGSIAAVGYPSSAPGVFAVSATDASGTLAPFSNRGAGLDIATYGLDSCVTTSYGAHLGLGSGTSYAAPVVSAVIAALRSYNPGLTPSQAEALLLDTADIVGGVKVVNAANAFRASAATASLAAGAPTNGLEAVVSNACEAPPTAGGGTRAPATTEDPVGEPVPGEAHVPGVVIVGTDAVPAPIVGVASPAAYAGSKLVPAKPRLQMLRLTRGRLTVRIAGPRDGDRTVFRVDNRRFVRVRPVLSVRLEIRAWHVIRVQLHRPGVGASPTLVIRRDQEF
jgi:subtilisin family serine protease